MGERLSIGIDIGTTSISAAVLDAFSGRAVKTETLPNPGVLPGNGSWDKRQDVKKIFEAVAGLADALTREYTDISAIGITGQMHGIVYLDSDNRPVSDLYTWEDGRAGIPGEDGKTTVKRLYEKTGYSLSPGYGLATHAALSERGEVPPDAALLCTVMDYAAAELCGTTPVCHVTNAASLGFFDIAERAFCKDAIRLAGLDPSILPQVTDEVKVVGRYHGIPVISAVGDNQASVVGSVGNTPGGLLANFGTGSQISLICDRAILDSFVPTPVLELRPFFGDALLLSGSALCGGRAYAILEGFFRSFCREAGYGDEPCYEVLNRLAERGISRRICDPASAIEVCTAFCGTRADSAKRGGIENIGEDNFTPEALSAGVLYGMAQEMYGMYLDTVKMTGGAPIRVFAASGNGVRKNAALRRVLADVFGTEPLIPASSEEAAYGAALLAADAVLPELAAVPLDSRIGYLNR